MSPFHGKKILRVPKINNNPDGSQFDLLNITANSRAKPFEKNELEITTIFQNSNIVNGNSPKQLNMPAPMM